MNPLADEESNLARELAEAAWQRLRAIALNVSRYENFVQLGPGALLPAEADADTTGESEQNPSRRFEGLALEFLLMNLSEAVQPENFRLLKTLFEREPAGLGDLARSAAVAELLVRERLGALQQAGLVERNYDTGQFALTPPGRLMVQFVLAAQNLLLEMIQQQLPEIMPQSTKKAK
ncbi:MAG: hypothetical protein D6814_04530 [Calditrichaeota bacterium]|nr:MAG: hypothetical protein D6814_04530 [Calditrichota bacterium]